MFFDGPWVTHSRRAMPALERPSAINASTSRSLALSAASGYSNSPSVTALANWCSGGVRARRLRPSLVRVIAPVAPAEPSTLSWPVAAWSGGSRGSSRR